MAAKAIRTKVTEEKSEVAPKSLKEGILRKSDGTIELTVIIPWVEAQKAQTEIENDLVKHVQLAGFRKGQAPKHIAKEKLNPELVKEELLKKVVGKAYNDAVTKNKLTPIVSPRVHIEVFTEGTDIIFTAQTCEEPVVELKNYKEEVKKLTSKSQPKADSPMAEKSSDKDPSASFGSAQDKSSGQAGKEESKVSLDEILDLVLKVSTIQIPEILIENEVPRLLSQMLDELKKLGLTLDQYLASRKMEAEKLRLEYKTKAEQDLKLEFILRKIADSEKITVEKEDIEKAITSMENPKEREEVMKNPYLVASIIRQQKTVTFLSEL